ncbi:Na+-transporting methylmalonyl-CoA/oxaloacetate decarboxylase gamma subunit [Salibacterium salarium]|uniref:hypothetical protein n=1 Tax=Salibacterium salarium TaxID=284579 RepID=UPI00277FCB5A|nr:hypothetical protein [Salibacterium salarium]MDQ0300306.1 Na+-transporting methylmalonyl-CoA/oxaloacetate decarboxylase gamma subunit [Salibacterium salarium]
MEQLITDNGLYAALIYMLVFTFQQVTLLWIHKRGNHIEGIEQLHYKLILTKDTKRFLIHLGLGSVLLYALFLFYVTDSHPYYYNAYVYGTFIFISIFLISGVAGLFTGFSLPHNVNSILDLKLRIDFYVLGVGIVLLLLYFIIGGTFLLTASVLGIMIGITNYIKHKDHAKTMNNSSSKEDKDT